MIRPRQTHSDFNAPFYMRRCLGCSNFMNWRVRWDGSARCLNCGREHAQREPSGARPGSGLAGILNHETS